MSGGIAALVGLYWRPRELRLRVRAGEDSAVVVQRHVSNVFTASLWVSTPRQAQDKLSGVQARPPGGKGEVTPS